MTSQPEDTWHYWTPKIPIELAAELEPEIARDNDAGVPIRLYLRASSRWAWYDSVPLPAEPEGA